MWCPAQSEFRGNVFRWSGALYSKSSMFALRPGGEPLAGHGGAEPVPVVHRVERAEAAGADPRRLEGMLGAAGPAAECCGRHRVKLLSSRSTSVRDWHLASFAQVAEASQGRSLSLS